MHFCLGDDANDDDDDVDDDDCYEFSYKFEVGIL